jgi:transcriptional regulator NrdR family protein
MKCPKCNHARSLVLKSELMPSGTTRQRVHRCASCGHLFTTTEAVDGR